MPEDREALLCQKQGYIPDVNDGVCVNVAPLQENGLLADEVLSAKNAGMVIMDRAEWRADKRRRCWEKKFSWPGWRTRKRGK